MKRILTAALVMFAASLAVAAQTPQEQARLELNAGVRQYKEGDFAEAQRHFERALELDPENKSAPLFLARAIHQQYRVGLDTPENVAKAEAAIAAYKRVLEREFENEDAYNSIAYLLRQLRDEAREREWLLWRAESPNAPAAKRADIFTVLASKEWNCSFDITEQKENKQTVQQAGEVAIRYLRPKNEADYERAQTCSLRGLELIERAIELAPEHVNAWAYKTNLLRERAKLAQMDNAHTQKESYDQQADEAEANHRRLSEAARAAAPTPADATARDDASSETQTPAVIASETPTPRPTDDAPPARRRAVVVNGGVLNGKAVSKPQPVYPAIARAAGAQGTVTVQITIGESGEVLLATAVSGHPLLQQAAVEAARQARFSPTLLSGRPVRVTGVVTYNFVLQ